MIKYIRPFIDQKMYNYGTTFKNAIHIAKLYGVQDNNKRCPICGILPTLKGIVSKFLFCSRSK